MITQTSKALAGATLMTLLAASAQAVSTTSSIAETLKPGTRLSVTQKSALQLPSVQLGGVLYRVVRSTAGSEPFTTVVNGDDMVGVSRNELVISELATAAAHAAAAGLPVKPVSEKAYEHLNTTVLRFSSLADVERARRHLASSLPASAKLSVPIRFAETKPQ